VVRVAFRAVVRSVALDPVRVGAIHRLPREGEPVFTVARRRDPNGLWRRLPFVVMFGGARNRCTLPVSRLVAHQELSEMELAGLSLTP
jgi:hypothetical protein